MKSMFVSIRSKVTPIIQNSAQQVREKEDRALVNYVKEEAARLANKQDEEALPLPVMNFDRGVRGHAVPQPSVSRAVDNEALPLPTMIFPLIDPPAPQDQTEANRDEEGLPLPDWDFSHRSTADDDGETE